VINVQTCFKSLDIWLCMFVCCWGLNCWCCLRSLDELGKYEFLVKNEFDIEFVMKQCYEFVFVSVLIAFWCMLTNNEVWVTILGQRKSKSGFWGNFTWVPDRNPKSRLPCSSELAWRAMLCHGELPRTKPMVSGILGSWGRFWTPLSASFDVFDCCFHLETY